MATEMVRTSRGVGTESGSPSARPSRRPRLEISTRSTPRWSIRASTTTAPPTMVSARSGFNPCNRVRRFMVRLARSSTRSSTLAVESSYPCSSRSGWSDRRRSILARLRTVPPIPTSSPPASMGPTPASSSDAFTVLRRSFSSRSSGGSDTKNRSLTRRDPSGSVHDLSNFRSWKPVSSMLPPPRSIATPWKTGRSWTAPRKPNVASVFPSMTSRGTPASRASASRRSPSVDSRTADVATAIMRSAPAPSAIARKSRSASKVRSIASGPSRSSSRNSRPRRRGARASSRTSRCSPGRSRNTIIRAEFEPTSTTAKGRSSAREREPCTT